MIALYTADTSNGKRVSIMLEETGLPYVVYPVNLSQGEQKSAEFLALNSRGDSTITCPHCGFSKTETMPTDACQWFYECTHCHQVLKPKAGDCCVYCSYGTVPCPPIQQQGKSSCCSA